MTSDMVKASRVATGANQTVTNIVAGLGLKTVSPVLVTWEEKRQILIEELAITIAAILDSSGNWPARLQQLSNVVYQQKRAYIMDKDADDIDERIRTLIDEMRVGSEELMTLMEKEVLGELTMEDIHSFLTEDISEDAPSNKITIELFANYSEVDIRDRIQGSWGEVNLTLDKMNTIAAIEDTDKRRQALANHDADFECRRFEGFVGAAKVSQQLDSELTPIDTESVVRSAYLNGLITTELAKLAQALGRYDLDRVETEADRSMREARELIAQLREKEKAKIGELATVLQRIAAQKQQQATD